MYEENIGLVFYGLTLEFCWWQTSPKKPCYRREDRAMPL